MRPEKFILALLFCLLLPWPAHAHKVTVFAWVEGDTVHTQSKFSGGKKVNGGKIEIYDQRYQKILEGVSDGDGKFSFARPGDATALKIVLTAGMGHTNHWIIPPEELGRKAGNRQPPPPEPQASGQDQYHFDPHVIEEIVERAVERKLAPIKARLAEEAWGLRDIVAGIGYIIGLMGLASYIRYRKTTP